MINDISSTNKLLEKKKEREREIKGLKATQCIYSFV